MVYEASARIAQRFMFGEQKYARGNWREAKEVQTYKESATRHLFQYLSGQTDEDHLCAAAVNLNHLNGPRRTKKEGENK